MIKLLLFEFNESRIIRMCFFNLFCKEFLSDSVFCITMPRCIYGDLTFSAADTRLWIINHAQKSSVMRNRLDARMLSQCTFQILTISGMLWSYENISRLNWIESEQICISDRWCRYSWRFHSLLPADWSDLQNETETSLKRDSILFGNSVAGMFCLFQMFYSWCYLWFNNPLPTLWFYYAMNTNFLRSS